MLMHLSLPIRISLLALRLRLPNLAGREDRNLDVRGMRRLSGMNELVDPVEGGVRDMEGRGYVDVEVEEGAEMSKGGASGHKRY